MEGVKIIKRPRLKNPYLVVAWPGMGEVAFKSTTYLVEKLQAEEFAELLPDAFFYLTGSIIQQGVLSIPELPMGKFYFWKNKKGKNDLIIFISNAQPDLTKAESYSKLIISFLKSYRVKKVVGFAAMPQPIDHSQKPNVWLTATSKDLINQLKPYNFHMLSEGQISGMNGLFLGTAKQEGLDGFCILGDIPLYTIQIENPKAVLVALEAFSKIMGLQLDLKPLQEQAQHMEEEINKLLDYLHMGFPLGPIGDEEVEKIKKSLSQLTKLPLSIKERIEKLFEEAKTNPLKAGELKAELDKWNVYKEYEDRFLDLFRKSQDQGN